MRGITHRPTETRKPETKSAQPGATDRHAFLAAAIKSRFHVA
jgi:hypothetical protein